MFHLALVMKTYHIRTGLRPYRTTIFPPARSVGIILAATKMDFLNRQERTPAPAGGAGEERQALLKLAKEGTWRL